MLITLGLGAPQESLLLANIAATTAAMGINGAIALHPISLTMAGVALATAFAALMTAARRSLSWASGGGALRLRRQYEKLGEPALISSPSGRVQWVNQSGRRAGLSEKTALAPQLQTLIEIDEPAIYRLARRALDLGFALTPAISAGDRERCYLAAQSPDGKTLLWSRQAGERNAPRSFVHRSPGFETASFGHVGVAPDGRLTINAKFRELFGSGAKAVLDRLPPDRAPQGGRILLPLADGREGPMRVFMLSDAESGSRDYLFFPTSERASDSTHSAALEAVPVGLLRLNLDGRVLWTNSAARELLGPGIWTGQPFSELVEPLGRPVPVMIDAALRGLARGRGDMVRLAGKENDTFLQVSLNRIRLDENDGLLAVVTDASDIRRLEDQFAQSQKMEAVGKLAGGVAHDFNNVLTAISGHTDLLLLGKDISHPDYSDLMQIRQNANRAAALVRQLLAFSRKQTLTPEDLSLRDVVSDTFHLLDRLIGENVTLRLDHARDLGNVRADQQQLEQALVNLVVNARDAMPDGGVIKIVTRNRSFAGETTVDRVRMPPGDYVEIAVEDDGPGIPEPLLGRIFEPFFTTKPVGKGTGLGLSTVYGIVRQSGGMLTVANREEGGARFRVFLPRSKPGVGPAEKSSETSGRPGGADTTGRGAVLLVEDEAPVRSFARRALELRGYEVRTADSAEVAMTVLKEDPSAVDLIVSDVVMPGMDGPTFAAEARRLRPGLPVVFVSGYAEENFRETLNGDDVFFLPKPFSLTELTAKVKEALG